MEPTMALAPERSSHLDKKQDGEGDSNGDGLSESGLSMTSDQMMTEVIGVGTPQKTLENQSLTQKTQKH